MQWVNFGTHTFDLLTLQIRLFQVGETGTWLDVFHAQWQLPNNNKNSNHDVYLNFTMKRDGERERESSLRNQGKRDDVAQQ